LGFQVPHNSTKLMGRVSGVHGNAEVVQPKFGFAVSRANMNMRGLAALVRIEEGAI
jgi:hypothetical protein